MVRRGLVFLLLQASVIGAWADEPWLFRPYPIDEDAPFEQVRDILALPDGTVWLASWGGGVARIQGASWTTFDEERGLPSNNARCVETDGGEGVWIGTDKGLCHIRSEEIVSVSCEEIPGATVCDIMSVARLHDGTTWVGTEDGHIARFQPSPHESEGGPEGAWSLVATPDTTDGFKIYDILEAQDGSVWVALSRGGILKYAGGEWHRPAPEGTNEERARSLYQDADGAIWVAGGESLCRFKDGHREAFPGSCRQSTCVARSKEGHLFAGSEKGLWTQTEDGWESVDLVKETGVRITDIEFGSDDAMWLGSYVGPIRGEASIWRAFRETEDGVSLPGTVLYGSPDELILSSDKENNLVRFDGASWKKVLQITDNRSHLSANTPTELIDGKFWLFALNEAVQISIPRARVERRVPISRDLRPLCLFTASRYDLGLVSRTGIYVYEDGSWNPLPRDQSVPRDTRAKAVAEAPDGSLFVCYEGCVERWRGDQVESLSEKHAELQGRPFFSMTCSRDGSVWFGTYGAGLFRYNGSTVERYTRKDGLQSDHISCVLEASDGTIWVGHRQKGVSSYRDGRWVRFSLQHGLPRAMINGIAEYPEGTIWLAVKGHGLFVYRPRQGDPDTSIVAAPKEIPPQGVGIFSFAGFDAMNRTLESDLRYSWRIRKPSDPVSDRAWSPYSATTTLTASPPSPGNYLFEVRAADEDRNIDGAPASWEFSVAYPLRQRPEFVIPVTVLSLISLLSLAMFYRRHMALQRSEAELQESEARFRTMADSTSVLIWVSDTEGLLEFFNRGWLEFTGRTFDQEKGHGWIEGIHPEGRARCLETYQAALNSRKSFVGEWRMLRHDEEYRWLLCTGLPRFTGDGEFRGYIGSCTDITDRKHSEQEREELIDELQEALRQVKKLSGLLPICASCKKVRDDGGYWQQIEAYISDHSEADFSHGICPECVKELYPGLNIEKDRTS